MSTVEGLCGISAKIVCDSISEIGNRLTTFEIEYPRIILAELNTHRMLSKNSASSRAIPFAKMKETLVGRPISFGANQSGMQAGNSLNKSIRMESVLDESCDYWLSPEKCWESAKMTAEFHSRMFSEAGYHKQVFNRLTEPFQMMKTVVSGTEWDNFFWLRSHDAADPTFEELALCMKEARDKSTPQLLEAGQWHLPYVDTCRQNTAGKYYLDSSNSDEISLEDAIKVSCARSCAVSFRNVDYGLEKSREVYSRLISSDRIHGSALEHCATPMKHNSCPMCNASNFPYTWEQGISHTDRSGQLWSGNFRGFIQFRKLIPGENYIA